MNALNKCNHVTLVSSFLICIDIWPLHCPLCFWPQSHQSVAITLVTLLLPFLKALWFFAGAGDVIRSPLARYFCGLLFGSLGGVSSSCSFEVILGAVIEIPLPVNIDPLVSYSISDTFCENFVPDQLGNVFSIDSVFEQYPGVHCLPGKKEASLSLQSPVGWASCIRPLPGRILCGIFSPEQTGFPFGHQIF